MFEPLGSNVSTIMHAVELDMSDCGIRALNRFIQVDTGGSNAEHTSAGSLEALSAQRRPRMKYSGSGSFCLVDTGDRHACVELSRISAGRHYHAYRWTGTPLQRDGAQLT